VGVVRYFVAIVIICGGAFCIAECPSIGDLNGDCSVDIEDLAVFVDAWLDDSAAGPNLNKLGTVDLSDFAIFSKHWGEMGYPLVINEIMADNKGAIEDPDEAGEYPDWIELYNAGVIPIDIGGMYLTDTLSIPTMWQVPTNAASQTTIPGGGYLIIWADGDTAQGPLHAGFKLSAGGEEVGLFDRTGTRIDAITFGGQGVDESYGRYPNGGAGWRVFTKGTATPGSSNGGVSADAGILISEIMYHPASNKYAEYIELHNITDNPVLLYDLAYPENTWKLTDEDGAIEYYLPSGISIPANGYLLLVKNKIAFHEEFNPADSVQIFEWIVGGLSNAGEKIQISKPGEQKPDGFVPYIRLDRVNYSDGSHHENFDKLPFDPWPTTPDGTGKSLTRISMEAYGNDPDNWLSAEPTPGH